MMKKITLLFTFLFAFFAFNKVSAQCAVGEVQVIIETSTDGYGYEIYWELTPEGDNCGTNTIFSLGNTDVGCGGGGAQTVDASNANALGDNVTVFDTLCLTEGDSYSITAVDDWGDGGGTFNVYILGNSYPIASFEAGDGDNGLDVFSFTAQVPDYDVTILSVTTDNGISHQSLFSNFPHTVVDYSKRGTFTTTVSFVNNGSNPIDSLYLYYLISNLDATIGVEDIDTIYFSTPLATGSTYAHTFESFGLDTIVTPGDPWQFYVQVDSSSFNEIQDEYLELLFVQDAPEQITTSSSFVSSFETIDLQAQTLLFSDNGWNWKFSDVDGDGTTIRNYLGFTDLAAYDGSSQLYGSMTKDGLFNLSSNEVFQSPEMSLEAGSAYQLSVYALNPIALFNATMSATFSARAVRTSSATTSTLGSFTLTSTDSEFSKYTFTFQPTVTADDYMFEFNQTAGILVFDYVEVIQLVQPTSSVSLLASSIDEPGVNYCDSTVTVSFSASGNPSSLSLNWGDGIVEDVTGLSSASHQYGAFNTYEISLIAENIVGADTAEISLSFTSLPVATLTLNAPTTSGNTVSYTLGSDVTNSLQFTPSCARIIINWGDGTIEEVTGQSTATHTYAGAGTYDITSTVISGSTQALDTFNLVISSINGVSLSSLQVYPNPSNTNLNIAFELDNTQNIDITVYTVTGNKVSTKNFNANSVSTSFNTSNFNEGVYILKIETEDGVKTQKFVVKH